MSLPIELQQELELAQRARARKLGDVLDKGSLHYAALTGNLEDMETLVTAGVERGQGPGVTLNAREPYMGSMPLHLACDAGQLAAVQVSCWCKSAQGPRGMVSGWASEPGSLSLPSHFPAMQAFKSYACMHPLLLLRLPQYLVTRRAVDIDAGDFFLVRLDELGASCAIPCAP